MTADDPRQWLAFAEADLDVVEDILAGQSESWAHVCYLSQQAAEKMLKAYLVAHRVAPPRTHDLARLLNECATWRRDTAELAADTQLLNRYAVTGCYPGDVSLPTTQEAELARTAALRVAAAIRRWLREERPDQPWASWPVNRSRNA